MTRRKIGAVLILFVALAVLLLSVPGVTVDFALRLLIGVATIGAIFLAWAELRRGRP